MGGGFTFPACSTSTPPVAAPRSSFPIGSQPYYVSENDGVFGRVPSRVEVETAIRELQRFMSSLPTTKSEIEEVDGQIQHQRHLQMLQSAGFNKFSEAFAMMQAEPPLQNLVVSISCDKAVWEAILSNEAIHNLRGSVSAGMVEDLSAELWNASEEEEEEEEKAKLTELVLRRILSFTKSKILELVEKFVSLVNEIFQHGGRPKSDAVDDKLQSSLLLSLVILLIVVVTRARP